jgi:cytochrome c peroxidase
MATSVAEVLGKLTADPEVVNQFRDAYGRPPDRTNLLDAIATYAARAGRVPGSGVGAVGKWPAGATAESLA